METATDKYKKVSINRTFDLPLETVWKAWTEPASFKKWWGPHAYTCPFCEIDLRVGGRCLASMKGIDGMEIFSVGTYKEIVPYKKLVMTDNFSDSQGNITPPPAEIGGDWPPNVIISVSLEEEDGKINMILTQEPMPAEMYEDCMKGWQESLDKLESNLK